MTISLPTARGMSRFVFLFSLSIAPAHRPFSLLHALSRQRAFRARRAAHLEVCTAFNFISNIVTSLFISSHLYFQALEQRVAELEEENNTLRVALNLPPANRPPLGKGPTGKDKPKHPPSASGSRSQDALSRPPDSTSRAGSADSPDSTRTHSLSPSTMTATAGTMRASPHSASNIEGTAWDQQMLVTEQQQQQQQPEPSASSSSTGYPMPTHKPVPQSQYSYSSPIPTTSRPSMPNGIYLPPVSQAPHNYSHTADRPMPESYAASSYTPLRGVREEHQQFSYPQASFQQSDTGQPISHHHSPPVSVPQVHDARETSTQSSMPYPHRRSVTEPQYGRPLINHYQQLPPPHSSNHPQMTMSGSMRRLSPPRISDNSHTLRPPYGTID